MKSPPPPLTRPIKDYPLAVRKRARELAKAKLDKKYPPKKPQPR